MDTVNRKLSYPEQKVPPLSKVYTEPPGAIEPDELAKLVNEDCYVQSLMQKTGKVPKIQEDENNGGIEFPTRRFVGVDPDNSNPYRACYFLKPWCFSTPSFRLRRSIFQVPGEDRKRHYVHVIRTRGKNQHEMFRIEEQDIQPLVIALEEIHAEIAAYPK